jgi:hypothetical protein
MKIKKDFGQRWRWDRKTFWKTTLFRVWARFVENFFEKRLFLRVTTQFFENFFGKRSFLHVTTYFFEKKTTKTTIFACGNAFFWKLFWKKTIFPCMNTVLLKKFWKKTIFAYMTTFFIWKKTIFAYDYNWGQEGPSGMGAWGTGRNLDQVFSFILFPKVRFPDYKTAGFAYNWYYVSPNNK